MDSVSLLIGLSNVGVAALAAGLAVPLVRGTVKRNALYGIKTVRALASDEAWYRTNRFGGWRMLGWSVPVFGLGLVALAIPLSERPGLALALSLAPLLYLGVAWDVHRYEQGHPPD